MKAEEEAMMKRTTLKEQGQRAVCLRKNRQEKHKRTGMWELCCWRDQQEVTLTTLKSNKIVWENTWSCAHNFTYPCRNYEFLLIFNRIWIITQKPFILKKKILYPFLKHNDDKNSPNYCSKVCVSWSDDVLKTHTILTCDLFVCDQCVCTISLRVSWLPSDPSILHPVLH